MNSVDSYGFCSGMPFPAGEFAPRWQWYRIHLQVDCQQRVMRRVVSSPLELLLCGVKMMAASCKGVSPRSTHGKQCLMISANVCPTVSTGRCSPEAVFPGPDVDLDQVP
jgi:hypothetical protein